MGTGSSRKQAITLVLLTCLLLTGCSSSGKSAGTKNSEPVSTEAAPTTVDRNVIETNTAKETKAAESKEESLFSIAKEINDEQIITEIMALIADVDWHAYNELSGQRAMELIDYLASHSYLIPKEEFPNVLLATKGLDGALTESYGIIVGNLFTRQKEEMIKDLAAMTDIPQKTLVISLIAYNLSYQDVEPVIKELNQLEQDQQHSDAEKEVIAALVTKLKNPY